MQAITTKYFGPGNVRGSRVKAECEAGSITVSWDHSLNVEENHRVAAEALATKLGWTTEWYGNLVGGGMKGAGYCWVFCNERKLAESVMKWATEPGDHGGNPHCNEFVKIAERILNR